jgi:hypothetical protein
MITHTPPEWSPSEFLSSRPQNTFLLAWKSDDTADEQQLMENLRGLNARELQRSEGGIWLMFSHQSGDDLADRVFTGLDKKFQAVLLLISDAVWSPK